MTGNIRGAGTNSKIHIVMHGSKGLKNSGKVNRHRTQKLRKQLVLNLKNNCREVVSKYLSEIEWVKTSD